MGESNPELDHLIQACKDLDVLPPPFTDAHAHAFFSNFTLERLFRILAGVQNKDDAARISNVLGKLLHTDLGRSLLPGALPYLEAAAAAPLPSLRRLAAEQYGNLLLTRTRQQPGGAAADAENDGVIAAACTDLIRVFTTDPDTGVAAAAAAALRAYGATGAAALRRLLAPGSPAAAALAAAAAEDRGGTVRLRVLALALELAAGGHGGGSGSDGGAARMEGLPNGHHSHHPPAAASASDPGLDLNLDERLALLRGSGLLESLLGQLADPRDALAALAALQLLEDLLAAASDGGGGGGGSGLAAVLAGMALPQLTALVAEPTLAEAAMPLVAGIVRRCMPEALPPAAVAAAVAVDADANGGGAAESPSPSPAVAAPLPPPLRAAPALLGAVRAVLDDRGDAGPAAEAAGLDALGSLGQSRAGAQLVLADEGLTRGLCERALGRSPHPEVRCAALHGLAAVAGLEAAGRERHRGAAMLPHQSEEALRLGVFGAAGGLRRPGEVLLGLTQQPFVELRLAAYRATAALALRAWFAVEVVTCPGLLDRLTSPREEQEGGAAAAQWRHAALAALWATVAAAAHGEAAAAATEAPYRATLAAPALVERVRAAVAAGPYGNGAAGGGTAADAARIHEQHFIATRGGGGGV